jgi:hypothetical protein
MFTSGVLNEFTKSLKKQKLKQQFTRKFDGFIVMTESLEILVSVLSIHPL